MAHSFDSEAAHYDSVFTNSKIGKHQRNNVWQYLEGILKQEGGALSVLELNCGTGEDAIWFAKQGCQVLATDASVRMLEESNKKLVMEGLAKQIKTHQLDLTKCADFKPSQTYDLVFSNFGGLNCLSRDELKELSNYCKSWLSPNGYLVMVIMPKYTALDGFYRLIKGQFSYRKQRRKGHAFVNLNDKSISCYYYNHEELAETFSDFKTEDVQMMGIIPSYLDSFMQRHPRLYKYLLNFEKRNLNNKDWIDKADHFLISMKHA